MNCLHEKIQSWRTTSGDMVQMWSCAKCKRRFAPTETSEKELRSALKVIRTWASVPGALDPESVIELIEKVLK